MSVRVAIRLAAGLCALLAQATLLTASAQADANVISPKLCFTLRIPGQWEPTGSAPGQYSSPDGRQFVGVQAFSARDLKDAKGTTLIEKEAAALEKAHEKTFKQKLTGVKLTPFDSAVPNVWKWIADPIKKKDGPMRVAARYFVDASPDGVIVIEIEGTPDDDQLARDTLATLRRSPGDPCRLPTSIDKVLDDVLGKSKGGPATAAPPPAAPRTYKNPSFPWTVQYPGDWDADISKPGQVVIFRPGPGDEVGCSIFSVAAAQFPSVQEFAEFWLTNATEHMKGEGIQAKRGSFHPIALANGVNGLDVFSEISGGGMSGRSRQIFALVDGTGYMIDCETSAANWRQTSPMFGEIIASFTIQKK